MTAARTRTRALDVQTREGTIQVSRPSYDGEDFQEDGTTEVVRVAFFGDVVPAFVRVQGSVTRNLGDMNFIKVDVSVELPCLPNFDEMDRVHTLASNFVTAKLEAELADAEEHRGPQYDQAQAANPQEIGGGIAPVTQGQWPSGTDRES